MDDERRAPARRAAPHGPFGYTRPVAKSQPLPDRPCPVFAGLCGALTALALVVQADAGPAMISPSELLANPDRFDGQAVTLQGTVEHLREKVSPDGTPYFKSLLSDGPSAVRVLSLGRSPCRNGMQATIEGTFEEVNRLGRVTYYHQVTATRVTCR